MVQLIDRMTATSYSVKESRIVNSVNIMTEFMQIQST